MQFKYIGDMPELMEKVKKGIIKEGGCFFINGNEGNFKVSGVEIGFEIHGDIIKLGVIDKPFLVSVDYVEGKIMEKIQEFIK